MNTCLNDENQILKADHNFSLLTWMTKPSLALNHSLHHTDNAWSLQAINQFMEKNYTRDCHIWKFGRHAIDTNFQRASELLYETITVSLFTRLPVHALHVLVAHGLATRICSVPWVFCILPHRFWSKRETACSLSVYRLSKRKLLMAIKNTLCRFKLDEGTRVTENTWVVRDIQAKQEKALKCCVILILC